MSNSLNLAATSWKKHLSKFLFKPPTACSGVQSVSYNHTIGVLSKPRGIITIIFVMSTYLRNQGVFGENEDFVMRSHSTSKVQNCQEWVSQDLWTGRRKSVLVVFPGRTLICFLRNKVLGLTFTGNLLSAMLGSTKKPQTSIQCGLYYVAIAFPNVVDVKHITQFAH